MFHYAIFIHIVLFKKYDVVILSILHKENSKNSLNNVNSQEVFEDKKKNLLVFRRVLETKTKKQALS
jgi:hypothetical protein